MVENHNASNLCLLQYSRTLLSVTPFTFGRGTANSAPVSSIMFLTVIDWKATSSST